MPVTARTTTPAAPASPIPIPPSLAPMTMKRRTMRRWNQITGLPPVVRTKFYREAAHPAPHGRPLRSAAAEENAECDAPPILRAAHLLRWRWPARIRPILEANRNEPDRSAGATRGGCTRTCSASELRVEILGDQSVRWMMVACRQRSATVSARRVLSLSLLPRIVRASPRNGRCSTSSPPQARAGLRRH